VTRRIHRANGFQTTLQITDSGFLKTPRPSQRNWLLNRCLREFADELVHLDALAESFVSGRDGLSIADRATVPLSDAEIMEDWQIPVMQAMVDAVCGDRGDILEIGFGRGVASEMIQKQHVNSHTIVECNPSVIERFHSWRGQRLDADIQLLEGRWQDRTDELSEYDGIFFHTYPLNEEEFVDHVVQSVTFAAHFFPTAAAHLRGGGVFTYLTNESDSLSRAHQRLLFRYFDSVTLSKVNELEIPDDTQDAMWTDSMVVVRAVR